MAYVTDEKMREVAERIERVYESEFRGKDRGRFAMTRVQLKRALGVRKLDPDTITRLQDHASDRGLVIIDLDDLFPCIERRLLRQYRRAPRAVFNTIFPVDEEEEVVDAEE